jgi:amino acid permease
LQETGNRSLGTPLEGTVSAIRCLAFFNLFLCPSADWWIFGFHQGTWSDETFVSSYINIPIFAILYFGYKFWKKTKIIPLSEIPIRHFIDIANANPEPPTKPVVGWRRFNILWS